MSIRPVRALAALTAALALVAVAHASSPEFWTVATQRDFLKGDLHDLSIDGYGRLILGPTTKTVYEADSPFLWSLAAAPDGTLYAGSGNEGKVFRIAPNGTASLLFDATELEVHALAVAPDGTLYVGTSPDGRIYKVNKSGTATPFFKPDEKYIWALAVGPDGAVYAGTGEHGAIYRVTPDGKGAIFYKAQAAHVTALALDAQGNLLAGTASPARVLRIDPKGKPFVLLDSSYDEIHAIRIDPKGTIYVAAITGSPAASGGASTTVPSPPSGAPSGGPIPSVSAEITSVSVVDTSGGTTTGHGASSATPAGPQGAVYRIAPDGLWDQIWDSTSDAPYDIAFDDDGALLVATGNRGRIYRLSGDPLQSTLLVSAAARQVTALVRVKGQLYYGTANPGKVFALSGKAAAKGTYQSDVRDAQMVATWGTISWRASLPTGSQIAISTRTGNTQTPDETWSDWSAPYPDANGSQITSPKARYLQWRVTMTGTPGPVLTSVTAAYLPRNLRPSVDSITVYPPGIVFQKPYAAGEPELAGFEGQTTPDRSLVVAAASTPQSPSNGPSLGRRAYEKGLQTLTWKASDPNDDNLTYDVLYRRESQTRWSTLRHGMTDQILVWDTSLVPDGTYLLEVVASDAPSNPPGRALRGELESSVFAIDNTPPHLTVTSIQQANSELVVDFTASDDVSIVQRAAYALDGQAWHPLYPLDGIADSQTEQYRITLPLSRLNSTIVVRALDSMNNVASIPVHLTLTTPPPAAKGPGRQH
ncbi:MAG: hypothetical protein KGN76_13525 [Acidobacteriota bacterium]|nr:hypothetical protein [Acidobacteriota bacterium]